MISAIALVELGADINQKNEADKTAIMIAVREGAYQFHIVEVFVRLGADIDLVNNEGESAITIISNNTSNKYIDFLITVLMKVCI